MTEALIITDVQDRGVANRERISIKVNGYCDLGHYWLGLGIRQSQSEIFPLNDNIFWFGRGYVNVNDWIFLYTGSGTPRVNDIPNQSGKIYTLHWRRQNVLFQSSEVFPYLISAPKVGLPENFTPMAIPNLLDSNWFK